MNVSSNKHCNAIEVIYSTPATHRFCAAFSVSLHHTSAWVKNKTALSHQTSKSQHTRSFPLSAADYRQWGMACLFFISFFCMSAPPLSVSGARLVSIPPGWSPSRPGVAGDRNNLGGLLVGSREVVLNEWRVSTPTVRGNPRGHEYNWICHFLKNVLLIWYFTGPAFVPQDVHTSWWRQITGVFLERAYSTRNNGDLRGGPADLHSEEKTLIKWSIILPQKSINNLRILISWSIWFIYYRTLLEF